MDKKTVELGDRVKDSITGISGIVVYIADYLYGCKRVGVQPEKNKSQKPEETFSIDEPQAVIIKKGAIRRTVFVQSDPAMPIQRRHGADRPDPMRHKNPMRRTI